MATKLTERQRRVLERAAQDGFVHAHDPFLIIGRGSNLGATIVALEKRGYLAMNVINPQCFDITDSGRAALAAIAPTPETADAWTPEEIRRDDEWVAKLDPEHDDDDARYLGVGLPTGGVSEPAANADAVNADDAPVSVETIQAKLDTIEWDDAESGRVIFPKVEQLSDGIGCEWFYKDDGAFHDFEVLGATLDTAMKKVAEMVDKPDGAGVDFGLQNKVDTLKYDLGIADEHIKEQDAEIARLRRERDAALSERDALERELEAVKQMFDGYQSEAVDGAARQIAAINRLTQACDKLQAERDALQSFAENVGKTIDEMWGSLRPNSDAITRKNAFSNALEIITAHLEVINLSPATVPPASAVAMIAALRDRDTGQRTAAGDVLGDVLA